MADHPLSLFKREAGGQHGNVSTPAPHQGQQENTTPSSSGNSTAYIVTGVLVPLVLIGIGAFIFYIWYRRKYPVRMVLGKDFEKFTNPAYSKRHSTLTLVREDAENYWDTFQPSGIHNPGLSLADEEEEEYSLTHASGSKTEFVDETDATVKIESIERVIEGGASNIEIVEEQSNVTESVSRSDSMDTDFETVNINDDLVLNTVSSVRPRKAMLIEDQSFEDLDAGFEIVSEEDVEDIEQSTGSDKSSLNDSTGTHTIVLSTEGSLASDSSRQENSNDNKKDNSSTEESVQQHKEEDNVDPETVNVTEENVGNQLSRDHDDVVGTIESEEQPIEVSKQSVTDNISPDDSFDILNLNVQPGETNISVDTDEEGIASNTKDIIVIDDSVDTMDGPSLNSALSEATEHPDIQGSSPDNSLEDIEFKTSDTKTVTKLTLSTENIFLEETLPTPTVVIQDSIIFESESNSPVHLDSEQETPGRQRRAHTIECVSENLKNAKDNENMAKREWYSFDHIDKMSISKDSLFEPIGKVKSDVCKESEEKFNSTEMVHPMPNDFNAETDYQSELLPETNETPIQTTNVISEKDPSYPDLLHSAHLETSLALNGSLSFDLLNEKITGSIKSDNFVRDIPVTDDTNGLQPPQIEDRNVFTSEVAHGDAFPVFSEETSNNGQGEGFTSEQVMFDQKDKEVSSLPMSNYHITQESDPNIILPSETPLLGNSMFSLISHQSVEVNTNISNPDSHSDDNEHIFSSEKGFPENKMMDESDQTNVVAQNTTISEETHVSEVLETQPGFVDFASIGQTADDVFQSDNVGQLLAFVEETKSDNTISINSKMQMSTGEQVNEQAVPVDSTEPELLSTVHDDENNVDESFKQFQTSFIGASTPTSSAVTDPFVAFVDDGTLFDKNPISETTDPQNSSSSIIDTFESFDLINTTRSADVSMPNTSLDRMLSTESSSGHSWELVSEDGEKHTPENTEVGESSTFASASIVTIDDEKDNSDKEKDATDLFSMSTIEATNKTKIVPTGIQFDFSDIPESDDDDKNDSDSDDNEVDIIQSNGSNHSSTGAGNMSWEVLDEDTEA